MERILNATQELVAERGAAVLTVADVATRAGVAVGTVYQRFAGRDALLAAAQDCWLDQLISRELATREAVGEAADFEDLVTRYITAMVMIFRQNAALIGEFALRTALHPHRGEAVLGKLQEVFTGLCDALMAHPDRPAHVDRDRIAFVLRAAQAMLEWRVTAPEGVASDNGWATLSEELPRMALCYLRDKSD